MANRDTAKPWFQTGKKPNQNQFYQLLDWLFFKDEGIDMDAVAGLVNALAGKASQAAFDSYVNGELIETGANVAYNQPANSLIEMIIVLPGADANVRIGLTDNGQEIMPEVPVTAATGEVFVLNSFTLADRTIYINGIPANSKIIVVKRQIKIQ